MENLPLIDRKHIDGCLRRFTIHSVLKMHSIGFLTVTDRQAIAAARRLAKEEGTQACFCQAGMTVIIAGIFAGFSAGANLAAALELLNGPCKVRIQPSMLGCARL
jgi:cysteine synthase